MDNIKIIKTTDLGHKAAKILSSMDGEKIGDTVEKLLLDEMKRRGLEIPTKEDLKNEDH